jgi:hypothetical protein
MPQKRLKGVSQSSEEPTKRRPSTSKPLITAPTTTPWLKVASREPPAKE